MKRWLPAGFEFFLVISLLFVAFSPPALAGPPLVCWPFEIGDARSLPWGGPGWNQSRVDYDLSRLADDTLALLVPETPVLVRMETLRRAAIYAQRDQRAAGELLARLQARAREAESNGRSDTLAFFDAGYLAETYKQAFSGRSFPAAIHDSDGYEQISKALRLRGTDPQMEFAAALVAASAGRRGEAAMHLRSAAAVAEEGSLLAKNLITHCHLLQKRANTLAELRAELAPGRSN